MAEQNVVISEDLCRDLGQFLEGLDYDRLFVLTDENTFVNCYPLLKPVEAIASAPVITVKAGDTHKSLEALASIWTRLSNEGATRHSLLLNLGGGMVTDMGGFAGATFKRGIRTINVPTTLMASVDAAVGGKTGINFNGLKNEVGSVSRGVRISEAKTLHLSKLSYTFSTEEGVYAYSIKNGKYGPYIEVKKDGSENVEYASIDQNIYYPGTFTDEDARKIFEAKNKKADVIEGTDVEIRTSRNGTYLYRESDGKSVSLPRGMKVENLGKDDVDFLFSLPKLLGEDEGGKAELRIGPYGYYVSYGGKNMGIKNPREITFESFKADTEKKSETQEKISVKVFPDLEGKPLEIISGRYGAYLKWGDKNIALSREEKAEPEKVSEERAKELALNAPEKKRTFRRRKS